MTTTDLDLRLVQKGRREPLTGLVEEGPISVGLAREFASELARFGWPASETDSLAADVTTILADQAKRIETTGAAREKSADAQHAVDDAKALIRHLRNALPMVLRRTTVEGVSASSFHVPTGDLARSVAKIMTYLGGLQDVIRKLDADFAPYFDGKKASDLLAQVMQALEAANVVQELTLDQLPEASLKLYETMGRVLESIEDLNRVGRIAFDGQAGTRARFNKDRILRARKAAKTAKAAANGDAPGPDKSATTTPGESPVKGAKEATTAPSPSTSTDKKTATLAPAIA
jgi:hypothetical protein